MFIQACYYIMRWYTYFIHYFNKLILISIPIKTDNINNLEIIKYKDQLTFIQYTNNKISVFFPEQICCNYKFISLNIQVPEIDFHNNIDLKEYYIVGNKINNEVIYYILKMQHQCIANGLKYILTIIDQDVKIFNIDETQSIIFNLNDYSISKTI